MSHEIKVYVFWVKERGRYYMESSSPDGARGQRRTTGTADKQQATKVAAVWEAELREGRYAKTSAMPWGDFRELFFEQHVAELSSRSESSYATAFNSFEQHVRPKRLADATTQVVADYKVKLRRSKAIEPTTVAGYLRHLKAAFRWANKQGYLPSVPDCAPPKGAKTQKMKGRPITLEEFERMIEAVPKVTPAAKVEAYVFYLRVLMHSGLRLDESLEVSWDERLDVICFDLDGFWIRIPGDVEKGRKNRILPMTQELIDVLLTVPPERRRGRVFEIDGYDAVSKRLTAIGKAAGVKVSPKKFASAHDLRRAFGTRLSKEHAPATLKAMMRHQSIDTTMTYYVDQQAEELAAAIRPASTKVSTIALNRQETAEAEIARTA